MEPERTAAPDALRTPVSRNPLGAGASNASLARLARAGGSLATQGAPTGPAPANRIARATLGVTHPNDPAEREAAQVASDIVHRRAAVVVPGVPPAAPPPPARAPLVARDDDGAPAVPAQDGSVAEHAEAVAAGGQVDVSPHVHSLLGSPGTGAPLDPAVQVRVEQHLGVDLGAVRVHQGPEVSAAAAELQARAFTVGADIFLGEGQSAADLELMAHEATHVVQQQAVGVYRADVARLALGTLMPDWLIKDFQALPGYGVVTVVVGSDPITGESAAASRQSFVEKLLSYGPFGAAVGPLLQTVKVLDDVFTMISDGLANHNLTFGRVMHDFEAAWDEMKIVEGVDYNVAIARKYLNGIVSDLKAFLGEIAATVIAKVRAVLAKVAEPFLEKESIAPYWNLAKKVLHTNPLTGEDVPATPVEILTEFLKVLHQDDVLAQMTERGTLQETADWVGSKIDQFKGIISEIGGLLSKAGDALTPANLPNLLDTLPALADQAWGIVKKIGDFAQDVIKQVLVLVKKSLLAWLSTHAQKIPGYELLTVILEKDPFTEVAVPRTAENLIKGFILLLPGGDGMYKKLAESGVIADAAGRITSAMESLNISWKTITDTFLGIWNLVTLENLLKPIETFQKIMDEFGGPLERIITFAAVVIQVVVELILRLMNFPPELLGHIIDQAMSAIDDIKKDPIAFLMNLIEAMKRGFSAFFDKVADYLLKGLADWMFRGLKTIGVQVPTELSVQAAITLVIQVSGITVESLWKKLADKIGQETVDKIKGAIELAGEAFAFLKDIQERGFEAIWDKISEQLSNLWDLIFDSAKQWIMKEVVDKAVAKVLSMLDPTGVMAVVNSAIAIFKGIQSVLDYVRELLELVDSYVSTVASIAKGDVAPGAAMLEKGLAGSVPVAIGFLMNQAGLGDVPDEVKKIVLGLRVKIDEAIDWLLDKAIALGRAALDALGLGGDKDSDIDPARFDKPFVVDEEVEEVDETHHVRSDGPDGALVLHSDPVPVSLMPDAPKFQAEVDAYIAAKKAYDDERAKVPRDVKKLGPLLTALDKATIDLVAKVRAFAILNPGASAPGVGTKEKHGLQGQRIVSKAQHPKARAPGPLIWQTRSEHVLPFRSGSLLWHALGADLPDRGSGLDKNQTTIVTYQGAAARKDSKDYGDVVAAKSKAASAYKDLKTAIEVELDTEKVSGGTGGQGMQHAITNFREFMYWLHQEIAKASGDAVTDTTLFVSQESNDIDSAVSSQTNSVRRGPANSPEPVIPDGSEIKAAADEQLADVRAMLVEAWMARVQNLGLTPEVIDALEISSE